MIMNNLIEIVLNQYLNIGGFPNVRIYFEARLIEQGLFGRVIFSNRGYPKIEISPFLNLIDISLVLAHELAHVLDYKLNGKIWYLTKSQIYDTINGEPEWVHDDRWKECYLRIVEPLNIDKERQGIDKCFRVVNTITVGHERYYGQCI